MGGLPLTEGEMEELAKAQDYIHGLAAIGVPLLQREAELERISAENQWVLSDGTNRFTDSIGHDVWTGTRDWKHEE
ncbi:MAG: hypothetical protein RL026_7 [Pseudomonadota bacterium]